MEAIRKSSLENRVQEGDPFGFETSHLLYKRLSKRVMAADQKFIPIMKALEQCQHRNPRRFAVDTPVAAAACQDQIPDSVQEELLQMELQHPGHEVVDIGQLGVPTFDRDIREAVETLPLLIAVQRIPAGRHGGTYAPGRAVR